MELKINFGIQVPAELRSQLHAAVNADFQQHPPATEAEGYERIRLLWEAMKPKPELLPLDFSVNFSERVPPEVQGEIMAHLRADFDKRPPQSKAEGYQRIRAYVSEHYLLKTQHVNPSGQ